MTHSPQRIRQLLDDAGAEASRALGQNFVADPNTVRRIARLAEVGPGDAVAEIGPGVGSLTLALAETGAHVVAVELDRSLFEIVSEVVAGLDVVVQHGDALEVDWHEVLAHHPRWSLVANLPYNVATTMVIELLDTVPAISRMLVMVQREVGERMAAVAGSKAYGIPSVKVGWWADAKVVGTVPASVFIPKPRVESALVEIVRHDRQPADVDKVDVDRLVETAFGQRRKMLRKSLAPLVDAAGFDRAGVDPTHRPENLDLGQWIELARRVPA